MNGGICSFRVWPSLGLGSPCCHPVDRFSEAFNAPRLSLVMKRDLCITLKDLEMAPGSTAQPIELAR